MTFQIDDIVKATVTKSRPAEVVGLDLEERGNRLYITDVGGLFETSGVPIHAGDQLLEVNGIPVSDKEKFPNGLNDVDMSLRKGWNIWVKVKKGGSNGDNTSATESSNTESHSEDRGSDSDLGDSSIDESDEETDETTKANIVKPRRKPRSRDSPFTALATTNEKRRGKKKTATKKKALDESDSGSENTSTTQSLSASYSLSTDDCTPPRTEARTCQSGALVNFDKDTDVRVSPISPCRSIKELSVVSEQNGSPVACKSPESPKKTRKIKRTSKSRKNKTQDVIHENKPLGLDDGAPPPLDLSSLRNILKKSTGNMSVSNILEEFSNSLKEKPISNTSITRSSTQNLMKSLKKKTQKRRSSMSNIDYSTPVPMRSTWEEPLPKSDCSTHSCMTNLIDPGDLMKIHGFKSKPKMNGATVEVIRRSKGTNGDRWDVRVKSTKHSVSNKSSHKRLISVSKDHLKHFLNFA